MQTATVYDGLFAPYQPEGVDFLAKAPRAAFLLDTMGLGKTIQAIRAADKAGHRKVLVVCPAVARINWQREFDRFGTLRRSSWIVASSADAGALPMHDVTIISPDLLSRAYVLNWLTLQRFDVLIIDEAQAFKNPGAKRTQALYGPRCDGKDGLISSCDRVWLLSGTLAPNNVSELWPHLRALAPETITTNGAPLSLANFVKRYCVTRDGTYGLVFLGVRNMAELKPRIRPYIKRRRAEDVLKDLPPIRWGETALSATGAHANKAAKADQACAALAKLPDDELLAALRADDSVHLASLRRLTGLAKVLSAIDLFLAEHAEGQIDKRVIFAHHLEVIESLFLGLTDLAPVVITGATSPAKRQHAIDSFQADCQVKVFIGQIQAASTAITLTAASQVDFIEASWSPADNVQAAKRCHRIGQVRPVFARFLSLAGSIDEAVMGVLKRKAKALAELEM